MTEFRNLKRDLQTTKTYWLEHLIFRFRKVILSGIHSYQLQKKSFENSKNREVQNKENRSNYWAIFSFSKVKNLKKKLTKILKGSKIEL